MDNDESLSSITLNGYNFHAEAMGDAGKSVIIALRGGPDLSQPFSVSQSVSGWDVHPRLGLIMSSMISLTLR